jgi:hypothetical protein
MQRHDQPLLDPDVLGAIRKKPALLRALCLTNRGDGDPIRCHAIRLHQNAVDPSMISRLE